nr:protein-glutamate O-methyltransferase CheR [uncultured Rhodoferax sp.]
MTQLLLPEHVYKQIADLMYDAVGLSFNDSKRFLIQSRLTSRIQKLGLASFAEYASLLGDESQTTEFQVAVDLLTTNETYFFREPEHYDVLEQHIARWGNRQSLRIWSAASSFGDEAYSTAMLLADLQVAGKVAEGWSILATDISQRVLLSAKDAVYPRERLRAVSPERMRRYCLKGEGDLEGLIKLQEKVTQHVRFGQLNLCKPFDWNQAFFDVIFLRNVLIYFDAQTKVDVVDRVLAMLRPGGLFFIGTAEGRVPCKTPLHALRPGAFVKKE